MRAASNITDTYTNFQVYLLSVVQNGELLFTRTFDNPADFINGIRGITHPPVDTVCSDSLLLGVNSILDSEDFQKYPDSPIYVFSDGVLNDGVATMGYALQQMSLYRPQVSSPLLCTLSSAVFHPLRLCQWFLRCGYLS